MQRNVTKITEQFNKKNRARCIWKRVVSIMACAVVFCTTYALILPAITLEKETDRTAEAIAMIDALPSAEEIAATLTGYEESGDEAGYAAYFEEVSLQAKTAYAYYEDMDEALQEGVTNADRLMDLTWMWSAEPLAVTGTLPVYQVNTYTQAKTTLVSGGSVQEKLGTGMGFTFWDAIVVEKNDSGQLYVAKYDKEDGSKLDYKAETADGFVLFLYNTTVNAAVGNYVTVDFDYRTTRAYTASGCGNVIFSSGTQVKAEKDNTSKLTVVQGANTRDLIEVNLYDYNANVNKKWDSDKRYPGFQQDGGQKSAGAVSSSNFGNNITEELDTVKNITGGSYTINQTAGNGTSYGAANIPVSGAMQKTMGADGYPALADGTSLKYLWSESDSDCTTKMNEKSINGLFQYDTKTGAYTYNSRENHAQFNPSDDTFTLYEQVISSNFMWYPFGNFLPFNDIVHEASQASAIDRAYLKTIANTAATKYESGMRSEYNTLATTMNTWIGLMDTEYGTNWGANEATKAYFQSGPGKNNSSFDYNKVLNQLPNVYSIDFDEPTDFFFGMEMKMNFMQPKGGLTGNDGKQPMVFYFTGDDDVWFYVDDVLFLDLSGIHRHVGGEIDFVKGEVRYYSLDVSTGDVATTPYKTETFADVLKAAGKSTDGLNANGTFKDYSTHKLHFYYMERGAGSGVCRMNFNFPLLKENSISVTKELSGNETLLGNPDFKFQVLKEGGKELFIGANTSYDILNSAGSTIGTGKTDANGVFTLKAGQTAVFENIPEDAGKYFVRELLDADIHEQYGEIIVDGSSQTENYEVIVGSDTFKGVDSSVKDISDGATVFRFNNHVDIKKVGSLSIEKKLTEYSPLTKEAKQFTFDVTLDGEKLPVGTTYTVGNETRTVTTAGQITLAAGETAVISNILAGSIFTVKETELSAEGYNVTYTVNGEPQTGDSASGKIQLKTETVTETAVIVNNTERGTFVEIPIEKILQYPDGLEHIYTFNLEQVTDSSGATPMKNDVTQTATITVTDTANGKFTIGYPQVDLGTLPQTFYYKITEAEKDDTTESKLGTIYDKAAYVVEVTVSKDATSGTLTASITNVWKDGTQVTENPTPLTFTNQLIRYELPETGGSGTKMYTLCGLALMATAVGYGFWQKSKRERGRS